MANNNIFSNLLKIIALISGIVLFLLQIFPVWNNFVMKRTAFGTSQNTLKKIPIPPITLCPEILDVNIYMADPDLFIDQFYKLNDEIIIRIICNFDHERLIVHNLQLGKNFDQQGELLITLRELWHPHMGLCYVLVPNHKRLVFGLSDYLIVSIFLQRPEGGTVKVMLHNEENIELANFYDLGRQSATLYTLEGGTRIGMNVKKSIKQHLPSKGEL